MSKDKVNGQNQEIADSYGDAAVGQPQVLTIDYAKYERHLAESDLTEAQKREFLETLWNIIVNFVDLGFGVHPLQQACEQELNIGGLLPSDPADVVSLEDKLPKNIFSKVAARPDGGLAERKES